MKVKDIIRALERLAPPELKEEWDNVGLMVGNLEQDIDKILVCLDITMENVNQAIASGADMIISHHPLLFTPLKAVIEQDETGAIVRKLIQNNISAYSMHTNFDKCNGGMNDLLAEKLGLSDVRMFTKEECTDIFGNTIEAIGRVGYLDTPMSMDNYVDFVKASLSSTAIRAGGDMERRIETVALCSGSGGDFIQCAKNAGADVFVTADVPHHKGLMAKALDLNIIDAGHFETENIICNFLGRFIRNNFPDVDVEISNSKPFFNSVE